MGIRSVVNRFAVDLDVIRAAPLERVNGRVIDAGDPERFSIKGGIQPTTAKDLQRLPEGQRTNASIAIFTICDLRTGDAPGTRADRVIPRCGFFAGVEFEIQSVEAWPQHNRYIAIKAGQ